MDRIIREWKKTNPKGMRLGNQQYLETVLFADDQVVIAENEDELQRGMHELEKSVKKHNMKISCAKTKTLAFKGKDPVRSKVVIANKIIEQVNTFRYLGVDISYTREVDVGNKLHKFIKVTGAINRTLPANKVRKETRTRVYNTLAVPTLIYGCEVWALKKTDKRRITAAEMRFMRKTAKVTLEDRIKSEEITKQLGVIPVIQKVKAYRKKWRSHVGRMEENRSPKIALKYTPTNKKNIGRPRRKLIDTSESSSASSTPTGH
jgi:hypothetical protein